jgi:hypothetical protein
MMDTILFASPRHDWIRWLIVGGATAASASKPENDTTAKRKVASRRRLVPAFSGERVRTRARLLEFVHPESDPGSGLTSALIPLLAAMLPARLSATRSVSWESVMPPARLPAPSRFGV